MSEEDNQRVFDKIADSITLIMFNIPRSNKSEKIPSGYVPMDKLEYVLKELGFVYIAVNKLDKIQKKIQSLPNRDGSYGENYVSIPDLVEVLKKKVVKYTDRQKLDSVVNFFDPGNTGTIGAEELEGMLNTFGKTE